MSSRVPILAITAGDPTGIGPEVILKTLAATSPFSRYRLIIIGDLVVFEQAARRLRYRLPSWHVMSDPRAEKDVVNFRHRLMFLDAGHRASFLPGRSSAAAGNASLDYLQRAMDLWRKGAVQALVTAPVTKWAIQRVCPTFVGHTEYLAHAMKSKDVVMMFVSQHMRVALLTRHLPLCEVARAVDRRLVRVTLGLTIQALRQQFNITHPRIAVCGLNPHAGEGGRLGREERAVLMPVMREFRQRRIVCDGPFAADGFFAQPMAYDAVVCGYHDQGLIPFKMAARDAGCQMSVGLPMIRTSPDHGSALDIAGRGIANSGSMIYALKLAAKFANQGAR